MVLFVFKQETAYEMRISDWSSDVCSSDLDAFIAQCEHVTRLLADTLQRHGGSISAEHGIGLVKRAYLSSTRSAAEIAMMQGVRRVFDRNGKIGRASCRARVCQYV